MNILIGCEESQEICKAFRDRGHDAFSNDIQDCSGGHPEWHLKMDVFEALHIAPWDLFIAHPPCKYLAWSGERWMKDNPKRWLLRADAFEFFKALYYAHVPMVCIENSLSYFLERTWQKPDQKVHPFHFGDPYRKTTCFWLRGLKPLIPTDITFKREPAVHNMWPSKYRDKLRSKTYPGIAKAMAEQWG